MIDLVIFTMEGREHLFLKTVQHVADIKQQFVSRIIVAVDGHVDINVIQVAKPDIILMSIVRRGYIGSICDALSLVESELFMWIEDDWSLEATNESDIKEMINVLERYTSLLQIRWSKAAPIPQDWAVIDGRVRRSVVGFSANPNISRTELVRDGFKHLLSLSEMGTRLGVDGFENVLSEWAEREGLTCAVLDPGLKPSVRHNGEIESTGREWHMTASVKRKPKAFGYLGQRPPVWRRLWMMMKLAKSFVILAFAQLFSDAHYDLAFRVVMTTSRRHFKRESRE